MLRAGHPHDFDTAPRRVGHGVGRAEPVDIERDSLPVQSGCGAALAFAADVQQRDGSADGCGRDERRGV